MQHENGFSQVSWNAQANQDPFLRGPEETTTATITDGGDSQEENVQDGWCR